MTQHNQGGITKKPKPREGPYSCPAVYCTCGNRIEVVRWNARARVLVVKPCACQTENVCHCNDDPTLLEPPDLDCVGVEEWCMGPRPKKPDNSWWCCSAPYPDHDATCQHKPPNMANSHLTDRNGEHCWCNPDVEEQPNGDVLVIHKAREERN
jgi:hypothetical protein